MDNQGTTQQGAVDMTLCRNFAAGQIRAGKDRLSISQRLTQMGMDAVSAGRLVDELFVQMGPTVAAGTAPGQAATSMVGAVIGGGIGALVGAIIWAVITVSTGFAIGYMAVGVGALCGFGVSLLATGPKHVGYAVTAIIWAVVGILAGNYFAVIYAAKAMLAEKGGPALADAVSYFSPRSVSIFFNNITDIMSPIDILFIVLAIVAAYRISMRER